MSNVLHTFVRAGETQFGAICRVAALAGQLRKDGYCIHCELCGRPVDQHNLDLRYEKCPDQRELALMLLDYQGSVVY